MMKIETMADYAARNETPEVLFWVGCAGSFDERAQKVALAQHILLHALAIHDVHQEAHAAVPAAFQGGRAQQNRQARSVFADVFLFKRRADAGRFELLQTRLILVLEFRWRER